MRPERQIDRLRDLPKFLKLAEKAADEMIAKPVLESTTGAPGRPTLDLYTSAGVPTADRVSASLDVLRLGQEVPGMLEGVHATLEAIVLEKLRPTYLIVNDEIRITGDFDRQQLVEGHKRQLETSARSVGRVDLVFHPTLSYAGTGWLVAPDIVVTNRHVAEVFAYYDRYDGFTFRNGIPEPMEARIDYLRQAEVSGKRRAEVLEILYVASPNEPDFAFLRVQQLTPATDPLSLYTGKLSNEEPIAAIGYPARDLRNDPELMDRLFGKVYEVKRFSPGQVTGSRPGGFVHTGDYTSLGGSSGSAIIGLEDGVVRGLHFAGVFREANYFVAADVVAAALARIKTQVSVPGPEGPPPEAPTTSAEVLADRDGYRSDFLGGGEHDVPLPDLGEWAGDVAPVSGASDGVLRYRHFSVIQSASRRLPLLTAVNIDGSQAKRLKRKGEWRLDGRLQLEHQVGNDLYRSNPLDRGHMVRRRDPGWGSSYAEAEQGEMDTFHYTNAAPQHADLNQKDWVGLEDYILEALETRGFKATVFTGPIFRETDRTLKNPKGTAGGVKIPEEFWKIAVIVDDESGRLSATGYVLSHGPMIRGLLAPEFVFGQYKTYQVAIRAIETATALRFGDLRSHDPFEEVGAETPSRLVPINGPHDILLRV